MAQIKRNLKTHWTHPDGQPHPACGAKSDNFTPLANQVTCILCEKHIALYEAKHIKRDDDPTHQEAAQ